MEQSKLRPLLETFSKMVSAKVRVKSFDDIEPSEWSAWLTCPVDGYLELDRYGPVAIKDVEWLEIRVS
jgi:hypothetical protein